MTVLLPEPTELLRRLTGPTRGGTETGGPHAGGPHAGGPLTHVEHVPARTGTTAPWPDWTPPTLRDALLARGIVEPWRHQVEAAEAAWAGRHVVIATGTGSGKSLAYQLPALAALLADERATALYLAPTKALAADQLRAVAELDLPGIRPACYDGDTPRDERNWVRQHARLVLTNPDMLHHGILPNHAAWTRFLRGLRFVVVDECHAYRGVFGSHVAHVLRRLRRVTSRYRNASTAPRQGAPPPLRSAALSRPAAPPRPMVGRQATVERSGSADPAPDPRRLGPTMVLASATAGDPARSGERLAGVPVTAVTDDASPRGGTTFALWEPPLLQPLGQPRPTSTKASTPTKASTFTDVPASTASISTDAEPVRRSALTETANVLADAITAGVRTLAFVRSRKGAEVVASMARRALDEAVPGLGERVAAYRSGYLREERRALEQGLLDGSLLGLASTNALELGVDLVGLDAVVLCGYPGTLASLWQQAGRAGRAGRDALCVLIARDDPLDTYLVHHPAALFSRPVEATVLDPANPHVLGPQLCCAAAELPLTVADLELFGPAAEATLDALVTAGLLRRRPSGWYWIQRQRPDVDLRGTGGGPVAVVESSTGRLLGTVDPASAHFQVHPGAVYLHQGTSYVVDGLDLDDAVALVHAEEPDWSTHPRDITSVTILSVRSHVDAGPVHLFLGEVEVNSQVVSFQRRRISTGEIIETCPLDLPERVLRTVSVWWTVAPESLDAAGIAEPDWPGALHAAEHASIGLLPLVATCDRWDIGGLSTAVHPDTGVPTVFVYDGHPGGAGFAERAYDVATDWLGATRTVVAECACEHGCPSCVQSPKCGNGNNPLGKTDAVTVLDLVLAALSHDRQ